jgi:hypothetical protein
MQPATYRDHFSSLFQSAAGDMQSAKLPANAPAPGMEDPLVRAASAVAGLWDKGVTVMPTAAPAGIADGAWQCATQGFALLRAQVSGNANLVAQLQADEKFGTCDPDWAKVLLNYAAFLAASGMRDKIPYIRPAQISNTPLPMKPGATVAVIGDWGTGTTYARVLLQQVAAHNPDVLIHLGDIYYSGTPVECQNNFVSIVNSVFDRPTNPITVFTLAGNHDMYSGGEGFYGMLPGLNQPPCRQSASFFCLRSTDNQWQFLGLDTGLHDDDPFDVNTVLTFLEPDEEAWHTARIAEFPGKTILLSHHQLFSALAQIGPKNAQGLLEPVNPYLQTSLLRFKEAAKKDIAAWFWGHEHMLTIYQAYAGLAKGRCLGCGAIPVSAAATPYAPLAGLADAPPYEPCQLPTDANDYYTHAFAILKLGADGNGTATYYQQLNPAAPLFTESL